MWMIYAIGSALFAGLTSILAKCGIKHTDSNVATALRTIIVLLFSFLMVAITGTFSNFSTISPKTLIFLCLSGLATGASWLCYFKALQTGPINKVVPIDKSSTVLTIVLAFIVLKETVTIFKAIGALLIAIGTMMMITKKKDEHETTSNSWFLFAVGSAVFASLTSILAKIGITEIEPNLGTAIRTVVVLVMAWVMVFVTGKVKEVTKVQPKELLFIGLSGIATGASWLCYYRALRDGFASVVIPIDKLSILVTVAFSYLVFGEKLDKKSALGLLILVSGTLLMLF